jgi:hypothetical protein
MLDVDILGLARDGKKIFAQVTHYHLPEAQDKLRKLIKYKGQEDHHLILFCDCKKERTVEGVKVFPIQKAFDVLSAQKFGQQWLKAATGR